ncbi:hypothetical protein SL053_001968 [Flavobacterium psychrophilum]|uniref:Chromosome partitioning protein ParA n=2 Tax=Flavobacterium psychrophilum TaxID=96345 RepID=A0A8G2G154_FLAPS|nr:hypothetical protein [Flavobacterium psychrophilum]AIG29497.1 hypothetical protein IA03_02970 [Flavobacterium psychrophilum]AIG31774.1 hypothetical protein IA01_02990 [Flavobacterium psychrophilum]AIG33928.1 hypothetical protein IA02_02375 [Flavobacterium psychrophilum]AIG36291.1 hypothetical protein IA04_02880 [Flavobacterium psychrophilum]AIG38557.1 hypothetical protein IA05_02970 [Flavobacterium psychrophilum]
MKIITNISSIKLISIGLAISLFCCLGFSYKIYHDFKITERILNAKKNEIISELKKSKDSLELAISENSLLKTDLIIERQKVTNLLDEINNTNIDLASLIKYKTEINRLKNIVASLTKEKLQLKKNNELLKIQRDSTILVLTQSKKYNDTLVAMNEDLNRVIRKGSKISIINLKTSTLKQTKSGDLESTDKASRVNLLQITFMVVGNKITKPCEKEYYVQIIDSKNNIIGEKNTKNFGVMILNYSYYSLVKFKNESLEVTAEITLENIKKGNYFVNVFDKYNLVSKTTFALK